MRYPLGLPFLFYNFHDLNRIAIGGIKYKTLQAVIAKFSAMFHPLYDSHRQIISQLFYLIITLT